LDYFFPLFSALLWGINTLVSKLAAGVIAPAEIAFIRWLLAALLLLPFALRPLLRHRVLVAQNWHRLAVLGALGGVVYQSLAYTAASYTSAINMGVLQALVPLLTILLSAMVFRSAPSTTTVGGAMVSLLGVLIVISGGHLAPLLAHGLNRGDAMMLGGCCSMAIYNTLLKRWELDLPLLVSMWVLAIAASVMLLPFYLLTEKHALTPISGGLLLYAALGASIAAPLSWMAGSRRLGPARVSVFFNLVPLVTAVLAVLLLAEPFSGALLLGGALTLAGVVIVEVIPQHKRKYGTVQKDP
jgi:drug/metabolite transporter (DMT)-like permease